MKRVLLVGGTGFIGRRAAAVLAAQGVMPRILDLPASLARMQAGTTFEMVEGDVTDAS